MNVISVYTIIDTFRCCGETNRDIVHTTHSLHASFFSRPRLAVFFPFSDALGINPNSRNTPQILRHCHARDPNINHQ